MRVDPWISIPIYKSTVIHGEFPGFSGGFCPNPEIPQIT
jgi:hypothetical protein